PVVRGPVLPAAPVRGAAPRRARCRRRLLQRDRQYALFPDGHARRAGGGGHGHGADRLRAQRRLAGAEAGGGGRCGPAASVPGPGAVRAGAAAGPPRALDLPRAGLGAAAGAAVRGRADRGQAADRGHAAATAGRVRRPLRAGAGPAGRALPQSPQASGGASGPRSARPSWPATPMPWWKLSPPPSQPATPTSTAMTEDSIRPQGQTTATGSLQRSQVFAAATASSITAASAWLQADTCRRTTGISSRS